MKKFVYTVEKVKGYCACGYKVGDVIICEGLNTPSNAFCGGAFMALYPIQTALHCGAKFNHSSTPNSLSNLACPDNGNVIFSITMID